MRVHHGVLRSCGRVRSCQLAPRQVEVRPRGRRCAAGHMRATRAARSGFGANAPVAAIRPRAPSSAPGTSSRASRRCALVRAGHPQRAGLLGREAEAAIVGRIADQQHGAVAEPRAASRGAPHQRRADPAAAPRVVDRERAEQQRRPRRPGRNVPQPDGADDAPSFGRDERQAFRRQAIFAQPLGRLGDSARRRRRVEQRLARRDVARSPGGS